MGPLEVAVGEDEPAVAKARFRNGEVGAGVMGVEDDGGRVSQESVRRHEFRTRENELGAKGSWVEV